jgi:hypothetical protein
VLYVPSEMGKLTISKGVKHANGQRSTEHGASHDAIFSQVASQGTERSMSMMQILRCTDSQHRRYRCLHNFVGYKASCMARAHVCATLLSECHVQHAKLQSCHVKPIYKRLIWMKQVEEADPDLQAMPKKQTYHVSYSRIE